MNNNKYYYSKTYKSQIALIHINLWENRKMNKIKVKEKNKTLKKGRIKRKILRKVIFENKIVD